MKPGHRRRHDPPPHPERRGDADRPARGAADRRHRALGLDQRLEHLQRAVVERRALLGRGQLARGAVEQPHPEMRLQRLQPGRGHRRRQPQVVPGGRQVPQLVDPDEQAQVVEIGHAAVVAFFGICTKRMRAAPRLPRVRTRTCKSRRRTEAGRRTMTDTLIRGTAAQLLRRAARRRSRELPLPRGRRAAGPRRPHRRGRASMPTLAPRAAPARRSSTTART